MLGVRAGRVELCGHNGAAQPQPVVEAGSGNGGGASGRLAGPACLGLIRQGHAGRG